MSVASTCHSDAKSIHVKVLVLALVFSSFGHVPRNIFPDLREMECIAGPYKNSFQLFECPSLFSTVPAFISYPHQKYMKVCFSEFMLILFIFFF